MDIKNRSFFENNSQIIEFCNYTFPVEYNLRYCNFGFVVIPRASDYVYKYYSVDTPYAGTELSTYTLFQEHNILVPRYTLGEVYNIGDMLFQRATIENIRLYSPRKQSFLEFDIQKLATLLSQIHSIKTSYVHGNIHPSNFYVLPSGELGVFDLSTYAIGLRERDIARIFIHCGYNESFLLQFLSFYDFDISLKKVYLLALIETRELHVTGRSDGYLGEINKLIKLIKS